MSFGRKKDDDEQPKFPTSAGEPAPTPTAPTSTASTPERRTQQAAGSRAPASSTADPKSEEAGTPQKLTDAELAAAPQHVKDAAARAGGAVVRAAPKGGEGTLARALIDDAYPELQPPTPPPEYRAAPIAPGDRAEREDWGSARPTLKEVEESDGLLEARTRDPRADGIYAGGVRIAPGGTEVDAALVRQRSQGHLAQLLSDPRIELRLKPKTEK
jgi:hypothetical protein